MQQAGNSFKRRTFLATVGAGALSATVVAKAAAAVPPPLPRSRFAKLVGRTFTLDGPSGRVRATLEAVRDAPGRPGDQRHYALEFRSGAGTAVASGVHTVSQAQFGSCSLHLGPVERGIRGPLLEAVVAQL